MRKQSGLSLVELMIAITLGLMLTLAIVQIFLGSKVTFGNQQAISRIQESGRLGIEFISKDLRLTSSTGFRGRATPIVNKIATPDVYRNYVEGLSLVAAATGITQSAGTRILVIRGVFSEGSSALVMPGAAGSFTVNYVSTEANACSGGTADGFNGLCVDQDVVVSDYKKAITFRPTALSSDGTTVTISYAGGWGGDMIQNNEYFVEGAQVSAISSVAYFVGTGTSGRPALFQRINGTNLELLDGVRDFRVAFSNASNASTYNYMPASVPNWNNQSNPVIAVRIELLVESPNDLILEDPQTYRFGGVDVTAADTRMYQVFTTNIALRNRLP
jgi:type IV pilus assembly protein PilW